jgi:hypothetical protein
MIIVKYLHSANLLESHLNKDLAKAAENKTEATKLSNDPVFKTTRQSTKKKYTTRV